MMLSRVAERLYWMARYLERAEDTARLTQSYTHLFMDIPEGTEPGWDVLINIMDLAEHYNNRYRVFNEQNVLKFLIADTDNHSSIVNSVQSARENVRTTRDVLPAEVWEHVNEMYLYTREQAEKSIGRRNRHQFLDEIIARCQMINGLITSTLRRDHAYSFINLGRLLERADMTTRVIDVGAGALLSNEQPHPAIDPLIWASLLQSLSAMGTYRRNVGPLLEAEAIVDFVFHDPKLPRSVRYCLDGVRRELLQLHNHQQALKLLERSRRQLSRFHPERASREELHRFIDRFQLGLSELCTVVDQSWFLPKS